jgi:hypothetical protein
MSELKKAMKSFVERHSHYVKTDVAYHWELEEDIMQRVDFSLEEGNTDLDNLREGFGNKVVEFYVGAFEKLSMKCYEHIVRLVENADAEILPEHIEEALKDGVLLYLSEWEEQATSYFWPLLRNIADCDVERLRESIVDFAGRECGGAYGYLMLSLKELIKSHPALFERSNLQKEYDALQAERAAEDARREAEEARDGSRS